ncbi:MAG: primase C-terminal domain-containing protein [Synergistaceae bacterium]|nr:primase C-terminal domain-containing protein [Synergistaceae bacterium]
METAGRNSSVFRHSRHYLSRAVTQSRSYLQTL